MTKDTDTNEISTAAAPTTTAAGDPPPPASPAGDQVGAAAVRSLSALVVANRLGFSKRAVLKWVDPAFFSAPCPHSMGVRRGKPSPIFNLEEVKAWRRSIGKAEEKTGAEDPADAGLLGGAKIVKPGADGVTGGGGNDQDKKSGGDLWQSRVAQASTEVDLGLLIARLNVQLEDLATQKPPTDAQPDWLARWVEKLNSASKEIRQLGQDKRKMETEAGIWIRRDDAQEIADAAAAEFTSAQRTLKGRLPAVLAAALADIIPADKIELARRVVSITVAGECDKVSKETADAIVAAVGGEEKGKAA